MRDLFTVTRPIVPGAGCLWCNGVISPSRLQAAATDAQQLDRQRYGVETGQGAPSVITVNAVAASPP